MLIKNLRLSFPHIYKLHAFKPDQTAKFSAAFVMEPGDPQIEAIAAEMMRVALSKWGDSSGKLSPGIIATLKAKPCLHPNDEKMNSDGSPMGGFTPGGMYFNASSLLPPTTIDQYGKKVEESDGVIYAGCYVNVMVDFWAQDNEWGRRINAGLAGVQFAADGDAFGGGRPASVGDFEIQEASAALEEMTAATPPEAMAPPPPPPAAKASVSGSLFL